LAGLNNNDPKNINSNSQYFKVKKQEPSLSEFLNIKSIERAGLLKILKFERVAFLLIFLCAEFSDPSFSVKKIKLYENFHSFIHSFIRSIYTLFVINIHVTILGTEKNCNKNPPLNSIL
jgi:hypothetical protein